MRFILVSLGVPQARSGSSISPNDLVDAGPFFDDDCSRATFSVPRSKAFVKWKDPPPLWDMADHRDGTRLVRGGVCRIDLADGREIGSGDSAPAKHPRPRALVRGDGFYLDRYERDVLKWWPRPTMPYYVTLVDGHYVSRYPIGPALLALPFTIPQMLRARPNASRLGDERTTIGSTRSAKRSAAAITTLAALALLGRPEEARPGARRVAGGDGRGTGLDLMEHRQPEPLAARARQCSWLTSLILLLWPENPSLHFFVAGVTAAMLVCCRPIDLAFAVVTTFWVTIRHLAQPDLVSAPGGGDRGRAHRLQPRLSRSRRRILLDLRLRHVRDPVATKDSRERSLSPSHGRRIFSLDAGRVCLFAVRLLSDSGVRRSYPGCSQLWEPMRC